MRKISYITLTIALSAMAIYLYSCASGGSVDLKNDPIKPSPEFKEGTVNPSSNAATITKEGISVTVGHWSRARLDRKYSTASMRSPFFYLDTWSQSFQTEVFHVTIKNDTPKGVLIVEKDTRFYDERKYEYVPVSLTDLQYRFVSKSYMDLRMKNGLETARQVMLMEVAGPKKLIPAGKTIEGFIPYYTPAPQAEKVWIIVALEKEPETATSAYQKVNFRFDFTQDLVLRKIQPPSKR